LSMALPWVLMGLNRLNCVYQQYERLHMIEPIELPVFWPTTMKPLIKQQRCGFNSNYLMGLGQK
jgi:hypothetical protein